MPPVPHRSALLWAYIVLSRRAAGFAQARLRRRLTAGKEDPARIDERMGIAGMPRPEGRLVWFHAASVGEAASLVELLRRIGTGRPDLTCLVTTVTLTSAQFLDGRLPEGTLHQFAPLDVLPWVERFLGHWRPDLAVWTESELWPATLYATHRTGVPMLLINARISQRSFRRWRLARGMARGLLGRFDRILAQDELAAEQLEAIGAEPDRLEVTGMLKEGAAPLPHDEAERTALARALDGRQLWLAASTHPGEEEIVAAAHAEARRTIPTLVLILAPRHPDRGDAVAAMLRERGLAVAQRSKGEAIDADTEVYLADTLGEMGLWYRVAPVSFVGGSLVAVGGHNPFEPALLGSAILHGPFVRSFADPYARLADAGAAIRVRNEGELARALVRTLAPDRAAEMASAAWGTVSEGAEVTDAVIATIAEIIDTDRE